MFSPFKWRIIDTVYPKESKLHPIPANACKVSTWGHEVTCGTSIKFVKLNYPPSIKAFNKTWNMLGFALGCNFPLVKLLGRTLTA